MEFYSLWIYLPSKQPLSLWKKMESIMNFMTRSGLNQQMQGEYRVLLLSLSHPRVPSQGWLKGYVEWELEKDFLGFELHD